jgi:hypothetical protein
MNLIQIIPNKKREYTVPLGHPFASPLLRQGRCCPWHGEAVARSTGDGRRPCGRWRWLEVGGDSVNRFEGFGEEGAHRGSSSTTSREGGGAPPTVGQRGSGGCRLRDRGASWTWGGSCGGDTRVGGGRRWLAIGDTRV